MKWVIGFVVWAALVGVLAIAYPMLSERSTIGAGYVAKEVCSCVALGGRDFAACRADLPADLGFERVRAEPLASGGGVRAWVPFLAERVARVSDGGGCTLE